MLSVTVESDAVIAKLQSMPEKLRAALYKKTWALALKLEAHIKRDKLQGQVLQHRSGNLQRSIQSDVQQAGSSVIGRVFSSGDVKYAAIHEFGGRIPPHVIEPKKGEALAFILGGKQVFFKRVNHPGSVMPERSFMRSALRDMQEEIAQGLTDAVKEATQL